MIEQYTVTELQDLVYRDIVELFGGDRVAAEQWLSSPIKALGDHTPASFMKTKTGLQKIRNLMRKWEEGTIS